MLSPSAPQLAGIPPCQCGLPRPCRSHAGWNGWSQLEDSLNNPDYITGKFKQAQAAKLNLIRFFVADDDKGPVFQTAPGAPLPSQTALWQPLRMCLGGTDRSEHT